MEKTRLKLFHLITFTVVVWGVFMYTVYPLVLALLTAIILSLIIFFIVIKDWWRRSYMLAIIALIAGASAINVLATVGSFAKVIALVVFASATFLTTRKQEATINGPSHRLVLAALWCTAAFAISSIIWSESKLETLSDGGTVLVLAYILHRTSTTRWKSRPTLLYDFFALYWTLVVALTLGSILAFAGFSEAVGGVGRHQGLFANPNLLGLMAAITFTLGLGIAAETRQPIVYLSLLSPLISVLFSQSRTALVATLVGVLWVVARKNALLLIPLLFGGTVVALILTIAGVNTSGGTLDRFATAEEGNLLNSRTDAWGEAIWHIQENPLGAGWAATRVAMEQLYTLGYTQSGIFTMHNSWFQIFNELGWLGLIPMTLLACAILRVAFIAKTDGIGFGLVATVVAGSMIHFTESVMLGIGQPYPYVYWAAVTAATVGIPPSTCSSSFSQPPRINPMQIVDQSRKSE